MKLNNISYFLIIFIFYIPIIYPGSIYFGIFDESIIYLIFNLASKGLQPYKDYVIHYPPGIPFLANFFHKANLDIVLTPKIYILLINLFLQFIIFYLFLKNEKFERYKFHLLYLIIFYNYIFFLLGSEPLTMNILLLIILLIEKNELKTLNLTFIFFGMLSLIFLRYDRFLISGLILFLTISKLTCWNFKKFFYHFFFKFLPLFLLPILILLLNLYMINYDFLKILNYIFIDPFKIDRQSLYLNKIGFGTILLFFSIICTIITFFVNKQKIFHLLKNNFFCSGNFISSICF